MDGQCGLAGRTGWWRKGKAEDRAIVIRAATVGRAIERVAEQYQAGHYIRPIGAIRKAVKIGETEAVRIDGEHVTEILRPAAIGCAIKGAAGQNQARFRAIAVAGGFAETVKIGETGAVRMDGKYFAIAMRTTLLGRAVEG